jgi:hypothetical protein
VILEGGPQCLDFLLGLFHRLSAEPRWYVTFDENVLHLRPAHPCEVRSLRQGEALRRLAMHREVDPQLRTGT